MSIDLRLDFLHLCLHLNFTMFNAKINKAIITPHHGATSPLLANTGLLTRKFNYFAPDLTRNRRNETKSSLAKVYLKKNNYFRQWQDSNLRGGTPADFESAALTPRPHCQRDVS